MSFQQFDRVKLVRGVPDDGIPPGTVGVIVEIYDKPTPGYEVEIIKDNDSLYTIGVAPDDLEQA